MDDQQLANLVIRESKRHRTQHDIILEVCQYAGVDWDEGQRLVHQIQQDHRDEILGSQNRLLLVIAIATCLAGLGVAIYSVLITLNGTVIIIIQSIPIPYLGNLSLLGSGLAMLLGGLVGLRSLFRR